MRYVFCFLSALLGAIMVAIAASADVSISTASRPTYDTRPMSIGQSLADQVSYTNGAYGLISTLIADAVSPAVHGVEIIDQAVGGSYACQENSPNGNSETNYWVKYNSGSPTAGPLLTAAETEITARIALSTQPTAFIFDQGQADVAAAAGAVAGVTAAQGQAQYDACWKYAFAQLQTTMGGSGPIPIYIELLGRQTGSADDAGYEPIRKLQLAWISGGVSNAVRVPDDYDMGLANNVHPDRSFVQSYGARFAYAMANHQYGASKFLGPTITSISQPISTEVEVHVSAEAGDTIKHPSSEPWGFDFYDGATLLTKSFIGWNGNDPQWSLSSAPVSLKMSYISGCGCAPVLSDPTRIITGTTSGLPLQIKYLP